MHVLVVGDFSGSANAGSRSDAVPTMIDVDNFDQILQSLRPTAVVDLREFGADELALTFASLDDFHPDRLYDQLNLVRELRDSRERLTNPKSYAAEAARLLDDIVKTGESEREKAPEDDAATMTRLLGGKPVSTDLATHTHIKLDVHHLINDIVAPHIEAGVGDEQPQLIASVDLAISEYIRRILHAPAYQRLEATWRELRWLVAENQAGEDLRVSILDVDKVSLSEDFDACDGQLQGSRLYKKIVTDNQAPGAHEYSLIIGDFAFDASAGDVDLLAGLGLLAAHAGAPFIAAADCALFGGDDLENAPDHDRWRELSSDERQRWETLRRSAVAAWIGLVAPRVIGRLPYGKGTDPAERFDFTAMVANPNLESFLWTIPAFACAQLIVAAFSESGWSMEPGDVLDLVDLPMALYELAGGSAIKPCAEVLLSNTSAEVLLERGVMALVSHRDRNAVRLAGFRSIADPPAALSGAWQK